MTWIVGLQCVYMYNVKILHAGLCNGFYPYNSLYIGNIGLLQVWRLPHTHWYQNITDNSLFSKNQQCFKIGTFYI